MTDKVIGKIIENPETKENEYVLTGNKIPDGWKILGDFKEDEKGIRFISFPIMGSVMGSVKKEEREKKKSAEVIKSHKDNKEKEKDNKEKEKDNKEKDNKEKDKEEDLILIPIPNTTVDSISTDSRKKENRKEEISEMADIDLNTFRKELLSELGPFITNKINETVDKREKDDMTSKSLEKTSKDVEAVKGEIGEVKGEIKGLDKKLGDRLEGALGKTKKPVAETLDEVCSGIDCIKGDIKKSQETQQVLESKANNQFKDLVERISKLEEPTFPCEVCGFDGIKRLSSFCPNCGTPIHAWNDKDGKPVETWKPYPIRVSASKGR